MSWVVVALFGVSFGAVAQVWAGNEELLDRAVNVFISQRGQTYIHHNFEAILYANGYSLRENTVSEWNYTASEPVSLDRLPPQFEKFNDTFQKIRGLMERWLKGFHLNDPRLAVFVKNIHYNAEFSRLGLRADLKMLRDLKIDNAVVLVAEAEIPKLRVNVGSIQAGDLNNKFLGHIGVNGFWTATAAKTEPLKIKIPLLVQLSKKMGLKIQVLKFATNLPSVKLNFGFQRPLVLPTVEVIVNGHRMELNHKAIEDDLLKHQASLVQALQNFLKGKLEEQIPEVLSGVIEKKFGDVREENEMAPPGAADGKPAPSFRWGLVPEEVQHSQESLYLALSGYVEDPTARGHIPARGLFPGKGMPALSGKFNGKYDIALALNQSLLNRVLQLSHMRGYYKKIPSGEKGEFHTLAEAPVFHFDHSGARDHVKLRIVLAYVPKGVERVAIKGSIRVAFDLDARFVRLANGTTSLLMDHIDKSTVEIDKSAIRFGFLEGKVLKAIGERIDAENADMKKSGKALAEKFPVPDSLFGIPLSTKGYEVLPSGYVVIYTEFAK